MFDWFVGGYLWGVVVGRACSYLRLITDLGLGISEKEFSRDVEFAEAYFECSTF